MTPTTQTPGTKDTFLATSPWRARPNRAGSSKGCVVAPIIEEARAEAASRRSLALGRRSAVLLARFRSGSAKSDARINILCCFRRRRFHLARRKLVWLYNLGAAEVAWDVTHILTLLFQIEPLLVDRLLLVMLLPIVLHETCLRQLWLLLSVLIVEGTTKGLIWLRLQLLLLSVEWSGRG